jgi:serine/threonine protein kinase
MIGKTLAQRYTIESLIGRGGMADVYRGMDTMLQRPVAVKILTERSDDVRKRFLREARAMAMLNHPNIVAVYDAGEFESSSYIIMEFIDGRTLGDIPQTELTMHKAVRFFIDLFEALSFAHTKDIIHRDIKPANIMIVKDGTLKIMDFGLSRRTTDMSMATQAGEIVGTIAYLAPERFLGKPADARSDLYSVGIVMYEIFTGNVPFKNENDDLVSVIFAHANEPPVPPRVRNRNIPPALETIIMKLLEKDPDRRYQSSKEVSEDLRALLAPAPENTVQSKGKTGTVPGSSTPTIPTPREPIPAGTPAAVQDVLRQAFGNTTQSLNQAYADVLSGMLAMRKHDYGQAAISLKSAMSVLKGRNDVEYAKTAIKFALMVYQKNNEGEKTHPQEIEEAIAACTEALPILRGRNQAKETEDGERLLYALQRAATTFN